MYLYLSSIYLYIYIVSKDKLYIYMCIPCKYTYKIFLEVELLIQVALKIIIDILKLPSKQATEIYIPSNSVWDLFSSCYQTSESFLINVWEIVSCDFY